MKERKRFGIAIMLTTIMLLSIFAILPTAQATSTYSWRDYEYPVEPEYGSALRFKMYTVDILEYSLPAMKLYVDQGVFRPDFLVSYMKMKEFMYRSCDPELWWFQDEMYIYPQLYGNYPGDSRKPIPQSAVSQAKKVFQDEYIVLVELNNEIRKLTDDYNEATGMDQMIIYSMLLTYKQIRNNLIISDMVMAYNILDMAKSMEDAILNSNGKMDLSAVGGPSDYTLENQGQILMWTGQASDDFDKGCMGLSLSTSTVMTKIDTNKEYQIYGMLSTELDPTAYTTALKMFEKTINKAGHALAMSGGMEFCMESFVLVVPAAVGIVLCFGAIVERKRRKIA